MSFICASMLTTPVMPIAPQAERRRKCRRLISSMERRRGRFMGGSLEDERCRRSRDEKDHLAHAVLHVDQEAVVRGGGVRRAIADARVYGQGVDQVLARTRRAGSE